MVDLSGANAFHEIGEVVSTALQFRRGYAALKPEQATNLLPWDRIFFVQEQKYQSSESLLPVLTLTGEPQEVR